MNRLIFIIFLSLISTYSFSVENQDNLTAQNNNTTDKQKDNNPKVAQDNLSASTTEKMKNSPCFKEPDGDACKKLKDELHKNNPCSAEIEKLCFTPNISTDQNTNHESNMLKIKKCIEQNKNNLSANCRQSKVESAARPYNCYDKCLDLKNDPQNACVLKCIDEKNKNKNKNNNN